MVHQVTSTTDEIERLRQENAGLELECAAWRQSSALKLDEIERLRAALQDIVGGRDAIKTARAALEGKP
jgi:hypothetical protein